MKKVKDEEVNICPRCGSIKVQNGYITSPQFNSISGTKKLKENLSNQNAFVATGAFIIGWTPRNPEVYICPDCDYQGVCPIISKKDVSSFKRNLKNVKNKYK